MNRKGLALFLTLILLFPVIVTAESVSIKDILDEYPGYEYNKDANTLMLKDGDLHEAPELMQDGCFIYPVLADGAALQYQLIIGGSISRGLPHKIFIHIINAGKGSKEYEINYLPDKTGDGKIALLNCTPFSDLESLMPDLLGASLVEIVFRNNYIAEDEAFYLNEAQLKLLNMTYSYFSGLIDNLTKQDLTGMMLTSAIWKSVQGYEVSIRPYEYEASAKNGTGGLYPWLSNYMMDRYPDYKTDGKDISDYLTYIIGQNGLGLTYDQLYSILSVLDSKDLIYSTLDALTGKNG